jgi:hypothetical protein
MRQNIIIICTEHVYGARHKPRGQTLIIEFFIPLYIMVSKSTTKNDLQEHGNKCCAMNYKRVTTTIKDKKARQDQLQRSIDRNDDRAEDVMVGTGVG